MNAVRVGVLSLPGLPLISLIYTRQVVNAVLLPLQVITLTLLVNDSVLTGEATIGRVTIIGAYLSIVLILVCVELQIFELTARVKNQKHLLLFNKKFIYIDSSNS